MSIVVDDSEAEWIFSDPDASYTDMSEAGWHQLADDPSAETDGYYMSTALWTAKPNATVSLIFQGTEIYLYSAKSPQGGQMNVTCDWNTTTVDLSSSELEPGEPVWQWNNLSSTVQHVMKIQMVGGERINIDKIGVEPGPFSLAPPALPSPFPPAFPVNLVEASPSVDTVTSTSITTMTMKMTMTMTAVPSHTGISLNTGAAVGIAVALVVAAFLSSTLLFLCWRRRKQTSGSDGGGLRGLYLPRWISGRRHSGAGGSEPSFIQIKDVDAADRTIVEWNVGEARDIRRTFLPSVRVRCIPSPNHHPDTPLKISRVSSVSLGRSFAVSTPSTIMATFPPSHSSTSLPMTRRREHNLAMTPSINTDIGAGRPRPIVKAMDPSHAQAPGDGEMTFSNARRRSSSIGFSHSDVTEDWHNLNTRPETQDEDGGKDDALFYAEHFSSVPGRAPDDYVDEPEDISPDTPLLKSPAVASSKASLLHQNSGDSHSGRPTRANKIIRSLRSRSSMHSGSRRFGGTLSRRTSSARTPISKNSTSTTTTSSTSSHNEKLNSRLSGLSALDFPLMVPEVPEYMQDIPSESDLPENTYHTQPLRFPSPPSAWSPPARILSPQRSPSRVSRTQRPVGPRARSASNASRAGQSEASHSRTPSHAKEPEMLSIVEETSKAASERSSSEDYHALSLLHS